MAYSINPNLPKARALAMRLLISEALAPSVVANKCGVHRSTVWRWKRKWLKLNQNVQLANYNRPSRPVGRAFRSGALSWLIPTASARPLTSPRATSKWIVRRVLELRLELNRCAEVIWHHLANIEGVAISLSSVRRILKRNYAYAGARKKRVKPDNPRRPLVVRPGELVETDTIHYICPLTKRRRYVYTVIDLYSRMAYAEVHSWVRPGLAASVIARASQLFGFSFAMVQADNGPEFSSYFTQRLTKAGIAVRHSRLGRPNDNAHIERFNRTIQEECLGSRITSRVPSRQIQAKLDKYLAFYNTSRVHLGLQLKTPAEMLQRS